MVAIKILRAKKEEEENVNSVARGHSSSKSAAFLPKSPSLGEQEYFELKKGSLQYLNKRGMSTKYMNL